MKNSTCRRRVVTRCRPWLAVSPASSWAAAHARRSGRRPQTEVLEWNQIFIDTLIATNTANSSSQRLGAIVHTAIFDAYNGIEQRYTPIFVHDSAPDGASRRAAVIAAAYTALVGLFPSQTAGARCQLCGFARGAERRWRQRSAAQIARARHRLGNRGRAGRARLARDRWVQRELSCRSPAGPRSASGGRHRRRSDR